MRIKILGISASAREHSTSAAAVTAVLEHCEQLGCATELVELPRLRLPFCDGNKKAPWPRYPDVARLRSAVAGADAIVLGTPEYHGGMSGALKNALDLLDIPHTEGTVFAAVSALGGRSNSNALNQIRTSVRWLHGWMLPDQVAIPDSRSAHLHGQFHDPVVVGRLQALAVSLAWSTRALRSYQGDPAVGPALLADTLQP